MSNYKLDELLVPAARKEKRKRELEEEVKKKAPNRHRHYQENTADAPLPTKMDYPEFFPKECRRKRIPRVIVGTMKATEKGYVYNMIKDFDSRDNPVSHEEVLNRERSLKRPMENSDDGKKVKENNVLNFLDNPVNLQSRSKLVIREGGGHERPNSEGEIPTNSPKRPLEFSVDKVRKEFDSDVHRQPCFELLRSEKLPKKAKKEGAIKKERIKKVVYELPNPPPELPREVMDEIYQKARDQGKVIDDDRVILVIQKELKKSDIERQENRFSVPVNKLTNKFLTDEEEAYLKGKVGNRYNCYTIPIIEPKRKTHFVKLARWVMGKKSGKDSVLYVLNGDWKEIVPNNKLIQGHGVQLWAFRIDAKLNFAFVKLPEKSKNTSSAGGDAGESDAEMASNSQTAVVIRTECDQNAHDNCDEDKGSTAEAAAPGNPEEDEDDRDGDGYKAPLSKYADPQTQDAHNKDKASTSEAATPLMRN